MSKSVQDIILDKLFKNLEENKQLPWSRGFVQGCINWYTETEYRGVNLWLLQGGSGEYLTFKQLTQYNEKHGTNYCPKKGSAYYVYWYQRKEKEITKEQYDKLDAYSKTFCKVLEDGTILRRHYSERYYKVFDIKDCINSDGECLPSKIGNTIIQTYSDCESVIEKYCMATGAKILERMTDKAYYTEVGDAVVIPPQSRWNNAEHRYRVIFHELTHSTGIELRLNRECFRKYHSKKQIRSQEELVAEFGSVLIASECGIKDDKGLDNSEAYVTSWGKWLKDNKGEIISAMKMAEKAMRYILEVKDSEEDEMDTKEID